MINTSTTIVTFLMVFIIQNTQNRDTLAVQIKLDELIRAVESANNQILSLDGLDDETLARLKSAYGKLAARSEADAGAGTSSDQKGAV